MAKFEMRKSWDSLNKKQIYDVMKGNVFRMRAKNKKEAQWYVKWLNLREKKLKEVM
jgi:hypothetical protein